MLFVEWWLIGRICLGLLIIVLPTFSFWVVRNKRWQVRIPVRILSGFVGLCGVLTWMIMLVIVLAAWPHVYSVPVYSPNGKMAARIDDYNTSGFGAADNAVELFTLHGLKSDVVYLGEWNSVRTTDLRWRSDSELEIFYEGPPCECKSTRRVSVRCIRR